VFIHGSYATTSTWNKMVEQLAVNHQCISIKLPGHGGAPEPDDYAKPTMATELAIVEQVVNKLTDQPIHLVGHSYGGVVALAQALNGNLALHQLTLFEPVAVWLLELMNDQAMSALVGKFLNKYRHDVAQSMPDVCGQVIDFWGGDGAFESLPQYVKQQMSTLVASNIRHWDICTSINNNVADLRQCRIPTQVICGTESNLVAHAICDHLVKTLANCNKARIDGASHFLVNSHHNESLSLVEQANTDR
jgi:pimeloyl-ACP methyl ester carboxylesterase